MIDHGWLYKHRIRVLRFGQGELKKKLRQNLRREHSESTHRNNLHDFHINELESDRNEIEISKGSSNLNSNQHI